MDDVMDVVDVVDVVLDVVLVVSDSRACCKHSNQLFTSLKGWKATLPEVHGEICSLHSVSLSSLKSSTATTPRCERHLRTKTSSPSVSQLETPVSMHSCILSLYPSMAALEITSTGPCMASHLQLLKKTFLDAGTPCFRSSPRSLSAKKTASASSFTVQSYFRNWLSSKTFRQTPMKTQVLSATAQGPPYFTFSGPSICTERPEENSPASASLRMRWSSHWAMPTPLESCASVRTTS
mmetsp:Transcript_48730/g.143819  ORF Transcript_48730/g.143819 Transcript_48730/m.143819 type:complete len:237 (-) Transcript_48730:2619-3329(-)